MEVLVLSNRGDATADYLCSRMDDAGVAYLRVNTESFAEMCSVFASPDRVELNVAGRPLVPEAVSAVWYRRPVPVQTAGDGDPYERAFIAAEWTAAFEGLLAHIPAQRWINHPANIVGASAKLEQLRRAAQHGLSVPAWCCTVSRESALGFVREHAARVVAKPLYCGYIERETPGADTVIYTTRVRLDDLQASGTSLGAPTLFQREVVGGVDVRVTLVDDRAVAVRLWRDDGDDVDIRRNNMVGVSYAVEEAPRHIIDALQSLIRSYGLRFAAVDMMVENGRWHFLEVNPNGQWAWLDLVGGTEIYTLFMSAFRGRS